MYLPDLPQILRITKNIEEAHTLVAQHTKWNLSSIKGVANTFEETT